MDWQRQISLTFLFIRPVVRAVVRHQRTHFALVDDLLLAFGVAFGVFFVKQRGFLGGAALRGVIAE